MSVNINMKELLEAGVHFGHQTRRWNPKMRPFIFGSRNGIHIIDLQKTVKSLKKACEFLEDTTARGGHVLFVGTKKMAKDVVAEEAARAGQFYVNNRWLGGTLTKNNTIRQSIHLMKRVEKMMADGTINKLTKKEALDMQREREKLEKNLGGIKDMPGTPRALFIIDAHKESIAVLEAQRLKIPIVAIVDTNCDPSRVDYPVPGNDDSIKSINVFVKNAAEACLSGKMRSKDRPGEDEDSQITEGSFRDETGHKVEVEKVKPGQADVVQ